MPSIRNQTVVRALASLSVTATGTVLLLAPATQLVTAGESTLGLALAAVGSLIALVLIAAGGLLYLSDIPTSGTVRVAAWNFLGLVVLGSILVASEAYLHASVPPFLVADILAVSAFAHVLIGYNDVRRIRLKEVAAKSERLAVLSRLLRHNLRTEAQVIDGYADLLVESASDPEVQRYAKTVQSHARKLGSLNDDIKDVVWALDRVPDASESISVDELVAAVVADVRSAYPEAHIGVDGTPDLAVRGGDKLATALAQLVVNAVEHCDRETPEVTVSVTTDSALDGWVNLTVRDNGTGIPDRERDLVTGESDITQLNHSDGLGLWAVKWITNAYDGALTFGDNTDGGEATLRLRRSKA